MNPSLPSLHNPFTTPAIPQRPAHPTPGRSLCAWAEGGKSQPPRRLVGAQDRDRVPEEHDARDDELAQGRRPPALVGVRPREGAVALQLHPQAAGPRQWGEGTGIALAWLSPGWGLLELVKDRHGLARLGWAGLALQTAGAGMWKQEATKQTIQMPTPPTPGPLTPISAAGLFGTWGCVLGESGM
eukprot:gene2001-biopygen5249